MKNWREEYPYSLTPFLGEALIIAMNNGDRAMAKALNDLIVATKSQNYKWGEDKNPRPVTAFEVLSPDKKV